MEGIMSSEKRLARIAGSRYLVVAALGGFAELVVRAGIVEPGNAAATADNIRTSDSLFRLGFAGDLVQATVFLFTAMALYLLLRHVHELAARAMVVLVAVSVPSSASTWSTSTWRCRWPRVRTTRGRSARREPTPWPGSPTRTPPAT
jgi:hypothetical protein